MMLLTRCEDSIRGFALGSSLQHARSVPGFWFPFSGLRFGPKGLGSSKYWRGLLQDASRRSLLR